MLSASSGSLCSLGWWLLLASLAGAADPPTVDRLFPLGGHLGSSTDVSVTGKLGEGEVRVLGEAGAMTWTLNEKRDAFTVQIAESARPGLHWIRLANSAGVSEPIPFAVGVVPEVVEQEPNATLAQAQRLELPASTVNGALKESRDVDTFAMELPAGATLVASLQAQEVFRSPMDAVLQVVSSRGIVVAQNHDDGSLDPRVVFTAPSAGIWYVRVFAYPADPNSTIAFASGANYLYRLTISTGPVVDHVIPLCRSANDAATEVQLFGWNLSGPQLSISREQSEWLAVGTVPVRVPLVSEPVLSAEQLGAAPLGRPMLVSGQVAPRETVSLTLAGEANEKVSLQVEAQRWRSLLDPVLAVYAPDGKLLKEIDDTVRNQPDAALDLTLPAAGEYRVTIRDRFGHGGDRYFYLLRCQSTQPSWSASLDKTAYSLPGGQTVEIPLTITRSQGFAEVIEFQAEGLPEGVTAEAVRSEKEGDSSKKVTLKLSATPTASYQGPIRVVGTSSGENSPQFAHKRLVDDSLESAIWLTVIGTAAEEPAPAEQPAGETN